MGGGQHPVISPEFFGNLVSRVPESLYWKGFVEGRVASNVTVFAHVVIKTLLSAVNFLRLEILLGCQCSLFGS
jgi:hypothetical protein